jgi:hypothetical protein
MIIIHGILYPSMDPLNYEKHMLPKIEYNDLKHVNTYSVDCKDSYTEFCEKFLSYVSADCHAISVDDEIVYNSYETKSIRESLQDDMIRSMIIDSPHSLFVKMLRENKNARVIVYMFGQHPWFVAVYYNSNRRILTMEKYKSKKYIDTYS